MPLVLGLIALFIFAVGGAWFVSTPPEDWQPGSQEGVQANSQEATPPSSPDPESQRLLSVARFLEQNPQMLRRSNPNSESGLSAALSKDPTLAQREQALIQSLGTVSEIERAVLLWGLSWDNTESPAESDLRRLIEHTDEPQQAAIEVALRLPDAESALRKYLLYYGLYEAEKHGASDRWKIELRERAERLPADDKSRSEILETLERTP